MANILNIKTRFRRNKAANKHGTFQVRDLREQGWFIVDNEFIKGKWLRLLKGCPSAVYFALCRHADKEQVAFPSVQYLMDETGYGKRQVTRALKVLEFHRLIGINRESGSHNVYSLLNKKHWRKAIVVKQYLLKGSK